MASSDITIPASQVASQIVVHVRVTGMRVWRVRLAVAVFLIRLGVWVSGMGYEVELENARKF